MAIICKNIWLAFYLVLTAWTCFFFAAGYYKYQGIYQQIETQQRNITVSTENSLRSLFRKFEIVLDMMVMKFGAHGDGLPDKIEAQGLMDKAIGIDPSIYSFGIFRPDGRLYVASSNVVYDSLPNLLENPDAKETFLKTLSDKDVVIGRTYYSDILDALIMPVRKTVRDTSGDPVYVLSSAIDVQYAFRFMTDNVKEKILKDSYLFRESDRYFQVAPSNLLSNQDSYQYQIPKEVVESALLDLEGQVDTSYEQLKNTEQIITHETSINNEATLVASVYLKKYQLWLTTATSLSVVTGTFLQEFAIMSAIFLASILAIYITFRNIDSSESKKRKALRYQANHDHLTKIKNRFYLDSQKTVLENQEGGFCLMYMNVDSFKTVNDNYGLETGDLVLKAVAERLSSVVDESDILVRFNSDEFVLICFQKDKEKALRKIQKLLDEFEREFLVSGYTFRLSASMGIARFPEDGKDFNELKRNAILAMYEAKKQRNTCVFFDSSFEEEFLYKSKVEHELKYALENNEISVVFQPQMNCDGTLHGVEALVRWNSKSLGNISPFVFIPIAESSGVMPEIGLFVLRQAMAKVKETMENCGTEFDLSVNVSVKQFLYQGFYDDVLQAVADLQFSKSNLVLEITESVFIEDLNSITELLSKFKGEGIRVSLDDFGTGFSSLSLLKQLPLDEVKIDKSFVDDMVTNKDALSMIEGIMAISKKLNLKSVAEGVEDADQKELLANMGCNILQGYYFSKPVSKNELITFIKSLSI